MIDFNISRFTLAEPLAEDRVGLFNTLTGALAVLPAEDWSDVSVEGAEVEGLLEGLAAEGFVVERNVDEDQVLAHWRASQAYDLTHLQYFISPTRACNMACSYCVHGSKKRAEHMSPETASAVLDFIRGDIEFKQPRTVRLDFCGAESLLRPWTIIYLAEGLSRFCGSRSLDFKISIITNGLALKPNLVRRLIPLGLDRIRVTISGPAEVHDRYRVDKAGRPTYERIMLNLVRLAGLVKISLTGQYDPRNGDHLKFPRLLDDLAARGLKEHIAEVYFSPILPLAVGAADGPAGGSPACLRDEDPGRCLWLQDQTRARGFIWPEGPPSNRCLANYRNAMVIDVDGRIAVCPSMMDYPDLDYGYVSQGVDFYRQARLLARELPEVCRRSCPLGPLCDGGCRQQALVLTGDFDAVNCLRSTYEHLTRAYIRRRVQENTPGSQSPKI